MHTHEHHHHVDFGNAFKIGISLNVAFVIIEAVCGIWFDSVSLLADAGHNLSDVISLFLAYFAFQLSKRKPSAAFTYGLGSSTIIASSVNGAILFMAVGAIVWEAIGRFSQPVNVVGVGMIWVAAIGVVINTATALLFVSGRHHDLNIKGAFLHMAADAAVSLGVVVAGIVIVFTGWMWVDPLVSLIIAGIILVGTWGLFRDSMRLLSHGVPKEIDVSKIETYLMELPGVDAVHDLHVWALSTTHTALTVHLVRPTVQNEDEFLAQLCSSLNSRFGIEHSTIQIERCAISSQCKLVSKDKP